MMVQKREVLYVLFLVLFLVLFIDGILACGPCHGTTGWNKELCYCNNYNTPGTCEGFSTRRGFRNGIFPLYLLPRPTLTYRQKSRSKLEMACSFDFPVWNNVSYRVDWYRKSYSNSSYPKKPVKKDIWCIPGQQEDKQNDCTRRQSSIAFSDEFALGDTVKCVLFMRFFKNKWTRVGRHTPGYFVGIKVTSLDHVVRECNIGENITVNFRPTVPIIPSKNKPGTDTVVVSVLIPKKYKAKRQQAVVDKCKVELTTKDITYGKNITIRGTCDNQEERQITYKFRFKARTSRTIWPVAVKSWPYGYAGYIQTSSLEIAIKNTDIGLCFTSTDPNLFTFDERYYFYNELGDYVMYSNKEKQIQVHVRLWKCAGEMTCVCGTAIREGKDVIVLSMCNKLKDPVPTMLRTFKRSPGSLSKGIQIRKKINGASLEHEVTLSSGTRVSVKRSGRSLDVRINAPATDRGYVSGLCGNFNNDPKDDFKQGGDGKAHQSQEKFAESWRLSEHQSFFDILPYQDVSGLSKEKQKELAKKLRTFSEVLHFEEEKPEEEKPEEEKPEEEKPEEEKPEEEKYCYCGIHREATQDEKCYDNANHFARIDDTETEVVTLFNGQSQLGMKRSVDSPWYSDDIIDHEDRSYFVDDQHVQHVVNRVRKKRSPKEVISKYEATNYCRRHIENSAAGRTCKDISGSQLKKAMLQCVNDLKLTGDKTFAVLAFDTMKYICEDNTLKNLSLYTQTPSGDLVPPRKVVEDLCPADCSGHGRCKNRKCICDEGFTALDCSMQVNSVPELFGIYNGGLCDVRERPCKKTNLLGEHFINSKNLTCHVKEVKVYPGSWSPRGVPVATNGKMTDLFGVKCNLPDPPTKLGDYEHEGTPAGGLLISVSNDGLSTSVQELRHVSYDSKCMNCSKPDTCKLKPNSCLIKGHCFAANEPNPRDWCQKCSPGDDQRSWIRRQNNRAPKFVSKSTYYAIRGENLMMQIKAKDPDNRPLAYSVLSSTATGYTLTRSGLLTLKVTSNENERFTFKVTDECGAFDTKDVRVRIVQCPCLNGGKCVPHPYHPRGSGLYQCRCPSGTSGEQCQQEGCSGLDCSAPRDVTVTPIGSTKLKVNWREPIDKSVDYYLVKYGHTANGLWREKVPKTVTTKTLFGLKKFTDYRVVVSVVNSNGEKMVETSARTGGDGS